VTDLRNHLEGIAGPAVPPTMTEIDADLKRGRHALRRRRAVQVAGGSTFAVAALVAAVAFAGSGAQTPGDSPQAGAPAVAEGVTHLVAYTGKQPKGFTIDKAPDGWFVQADDESSLLLAPSRIKGKPGVDPSQDPLYDDRSFVGKIAVMLQSKDEQGPRDGKAVKVGDKDGVLVKSLDSTDGRTLWVKQPKGAYLLIQFWDGIGLSQDEMVVFGAGVHVNKDAKQGVG
jgi:hypothetical protein